MKKLFSFTILILFFQFFSISATSLPHGYKNVELGMTIQETKDELLKNPEFGYKGERDVSLIPGKNQSLIETDASKKGNFLNRCWFQFSQDSLYTITINFNAKKIDYYSIFTTLKEKYGEPKEVNPQYSMWSDDYVTIYLEKNLSLKYIDNEIFDQLQTSSNIQKSAEETTRQMFLDEL